MRVSTLELCNFRSASSIKFEFEKQLNIFVGVNGSGKTTVLDALSICLSWLVKRIERETGRGFNISDSSLRNGEDKGFLDINVTERDTSYRWFLTKAAKGTFSDLESSLGGASSMAKAVKNSYEKAMAWPVIAYYPVNRIVGVIRPKISYRDSINTLDVYENALGGKANYQSFFEWFRIQDDILNEKTMSRSLWMRQHQNWIKNRVNRLLSLLTGVIISNESDVDIDHFKDLTERFEKDEMLYEEPRFLFRELSFLIDMIGIDSRIDVAYANILNDLDYMFHKMSSLSNEIVGDESIEEKFLLEKMVALITQNFDRISDERKPNKKINEFLWGLFSFASLLSLWWMTDNGKRDLEWEFTRIGRAFGSSNLDRYNVTTKAFAKNLAEVVTRDAKQKKNAFQSNGKEIYIVTKAIEQFIPECNHLRVKRVPRPHMLIDKKGKTFNLDQLSDGEKSLISLVGDIARRLAIANPNINNPLEGEGVILIDEIDLHLHPSWQRIVVPKLLSVFPNCQFFISTHSPQVISHVMPDSVFLLDETDEGQILCRKTSETYGMSLDRIVTLVMDDESRPMLVSNQLDKIFELIERKKLTEASQLIKNLKKDMPTDPELMRAEMFLRREKMKG